MKLAFANSAHVSALERLVLAGGRFKSLQLNVRYGVVIHPAHGPILIDTGYTAHGVTAEDRSRILRFYGAILSPKLILNGQPDAVLARFGFTAADVRFVIVTHFHADHVSGLRSFPNAKFIVDGLAWQVVSCASAVSNLRHGIFTELLPEDFDTRIIRLEECPQTTDSVDIFGDDSLIAIPLPGHAAGHFGVMINIAPTPVLYAVDAQWVGRAMIEKRTPWLSARLVGDDFAAFKRSSDIIAKHHAAGTQVVLCHDPAPNTFDLPA